MRCVKCNKYLWVIKKNCPNCGTEITADQRKKNKGCLRALFIAWGIFALGVIIIFIFSANSKAKLAEAVVSIQSNLADITSAKLAGNSIVAGKKVTGVSLESIKTTTDAASQDLDNLSTPTELKNYQRVAILWANKISTATQNTKTWKNISNQPGNFPLILDDKQAQTFFQSSVKTIAELKQTGADAIKNKNKEAMRLVAVKLLVQNHWLNGILHSKSSDTTAFNLISKALALSFGEGVPEVGQGVDVTCQVCYDPKVHWTTELWNQYHCTTKCNAPAPEEITTTPTKQTPIQTTEPKPETENNPVENNTDENQLSDNQLESYTYKNVPKRAICIGNNVGGVYCVEDAVQSTNEIAASAIGFADGAKVLSVDQWNNEYKNVDNTFSEEGTIGEPVSNPTATGGHLEGGMGTISTGEPDEAPVPAKTTTKKPPISFDGHYSGRTSNCNCTMRGTDKYNPCTDNSNYPFQFNVSNNVIQWLEKDVVGTMTNINSSGDAFYSYSSNENGYSSKATFHFYGTNDGGIAFTGTGTSTNYYRSEAVPSIGIPEYIEDTICQYKYTGARISN